MLKGKVQLKEVYIRENRGSKINPGLAKFKKGGVTHTHTHVCVHTRVPLPPPRITEITGINNHWSLMTLNIKGLNSPIKDTD